MVLLSDMHEITDIEVKVVFKKNTFPKYHTKKSHFPVEK